MWDHIPVSYVRGGLVCPGDKGTWRDSVRGWRVVATGTSCAWERGKGVGRVGRIRFGLGSDGCGARMGLGLKEEIWKGVVEN